MKINDDKEINNFIKQDNIKIKNISDKIFNYHYNLLKGNKGFNIFLIYALILIETFQLLSYNFTSIHYDSWKLEERTITLISNILGSFRLSIFIKYLDYNTYSITFFFFIIIIFILYLILLTSLLFGDNLSKIYQSFVSFFRYMINIISIALYIPIIELFLSPIKCDNGKSDGPLSQEKCWKAMHYLKFILGIIGTILSLTWCIFLTNFHFYPFQKLNSTTRIDSSNDLKIIIIKQILVLQNLLVKNDYLSLFFLLLSSLYIFFCSYKKPTFNNEKLEIFINIKNLILLWTNIILLISKLYKKDATQGHLYLLTICYPFIIYFATIIYREKDNNFTIFSFKGFNIKDIIEKAKYNIKLINSFNNTDKNQKYMILLNGNITHHIKLCTNKDCPLSKFDKNKGSYIIQKQCLLNYMNAFFNEALKIFPNNFELLILFINFNYCHSFNLNSMKLKFLKLCKMECSIKEKYILYCMEKMMVGENNEYEKNLNDGNSEFIHKKFQRLKKLIESSIKLYAEFWGIFSSNITNNINFQKLYFLGEKLNINLSEIDSLWENELKNIKMDNEFQNIVLLYSEFLSEILWNKKQSKEVLKKSKETNLDNIYSLENKKINEEKNSKNNLESLLDNKDYLIYGFSDEKGNVKINQISESLSVLLGYEKHELIGKSIENIYPNVLKEEIKKTIQKDINDMKLIQNNTNMEKDLLQNDDVVKDKAIITRLRGGYILPLYTSIHISEANDYSDVSFFKIKMENKQPKSEYAYFILTSDDLSLENISSSAINLGLSQDLIKKYDIKINNLLRKQNGQSLDILEKYHDYEEESVLVTWVFPDIIYPKDDGEKDKNKNIEIDELIKKSNKKNVKLQIFPIILNESNNISAFVFKITEENIKKKKNNFNFNSFIPSNERKIIMFDILKLSYIRTVLVDKKSGFRNLRDDEDLQSIFLDKNEKGDANKNMKVKKKVKSLKTISESESSNSERNKIDILTKEKIIELQGHNFLEIKNFISSLPLYGLDVALEKFRPNGDKYSASKITVSLIKIKLNQFSKIMEKTFQNVKKKPIINSNRSNVNNIESFNSFNNEESYYNSPMINSSSPQMSFHDEDKVNKKIDSDSSSVFSNVFLFNSIIYIRLLAFFTFLGLIIFISLEFIIMYHRFIIIKQKIVLLNKSYIIINDLFYTKYFVMEGLITNMFVTPEILATVPTLFDTLKNELSFYRQNLTESYDAFFSNKLCKELEEYMENTEVEIYTLTLTQADKLNLTFNNAIHRITSSINNLVANPLLLSMTNRDTYELLNNLLNGYYLISENAKNILLDDAFKNTKFKVSLIIIFVFFIIILFIVIFIFLRLLSQFSLEREKPINLFLTIKKSVFENLKTSAENFSNKLLNKLFDNEDEENMQIDSIINIQPKDININKFKELNQYYSSINKAFAFTSTLIIFFLFPFVNLICFILKYFDFYSRMESISQFISLFDKTNLAQIYLILSVDIFRSYLINKSIPILSYTDTNQIFLNSFLNVSSGFENFILYTSKSNSFINGEYKKKFEQYFSGNIEELLDKKYVEANKNKLKMALTKGLKLSKSKVMENIRFLTYLYYLSDEISRNNGILIFFKVQSLISEMHSNLFSIIRPWYNSVLNLILQFFEDYKNKSSLFYIVFFSCLAAFNFLFYFIIWRYYEEKLKALLKESSNLINLIPIEIKNIIIQQLSQ